MSGFTELSAEETYVTEGGLLIVLAGFAYACYKLYDHYSDVYNAEYERTWNELEAGNKK